MSKLNPHVSDVCKIGKGAETCRYLAVGADGWSCEKLTPLKAYLDKRVEAGTIRAQADNCDGQTTQFLNAERS